MRFFAFAGLAIQRTDELLVAVVTDGCSSGRCSEVGWPRAVPVLRHAPLGRGVG